MKSGGRRRRSRPHTWESRSVLSQEKGTGEGTVPPPRDAGRQGWPQPPQCSLGKELPPVATDEVPGQGLPHNVAGNAVDRGGGILPPDLCRVEGVLQVPVGPRRGGEGLAGAADRVWVMGWRAHSTVPARPHTHRLRIQGWGLQVRAVRSLSASDTTGASWNFCQMKFQASSPPVATMLQ